MKLPLAYYGDPVLRKKSARVEGIDDELRQLVNDMIETMNEENGMGLAAPQVHRSLSLFITFVPIAGPEDEWLPGTLRIFINPKILAVSEEQWEHSEGCLSIPKLSGRVRRPVRVQVEYTSLEGKTLTEEFTGLEASCVLHENDHINGVLYIDRIKGKERQEMEPRLREIKKTYFKKK
jgi:peptide deformylase